MPLTELEPTIPASERPQAHDLDRAASGQMYILSHYFRASINQSLLRDHVMQWVFHNLLCSSLNLETQPNLHRNV